MPIDCKYIEVTYIDDYDKTPRNWDKARDDLESILICPNEILIRRNKCARQTLIPLNHVTMIDFVEVQEQ